MPNPPAVIRGEDETHALRTMMELALKHGPDLSAEDVERSSLTITREDGELRSLTDGDGFTLRFAAAR